MEDVTEPSPPGGESSIKHVNLLTLWIVQKYIEIVEVTPMAFSRK